MVRDSVAESQSLVSIDTVTSGGMGTTERRRSTIIPVDRGNSRMLRQSINSYLGQASEVQEELTRLEKRINELVVYLDEKLTAGWDEGDAVSLEDEQMHEVEEKMSVISATGLKVKSLLRRMEPKKDVAEQPSTIDRKRPNRISVRHTQYHALALMAYASMSNYKQALDNYYSKLTLNPHTTNGYWSTANNTLEEGEEERGSSNEGDDTTHTPLLEGDVITSLIKVKQRLISQEYEIHAREKRVREGHKLTSHTYQSRHNSDTDSIRSAYTCTTSPTPTIEQPYNYDIEFCSLTSPYKNGTVLNSTALNAFESRWNTTGLSKSKTKSQFSPTKCALAFLLTLAITATVIVGVFLTLFFTYYRGNLSTPTEGNQNLPSSDFNSNTTYNSNIMSNSLNVTSPLAGEEVTDAATANNSSKTSVPVAKDQNANTDDDLTTKRSGQTELIPNTTGTLPAAKDIVTGSSLLNTAQSTRPSTEASTSVDSKSSSNPLSTAKPVVDQSSTAATASTSSAEQTATIPMNSITITNSTSEDNSTVPVKTSDTVKLDNIAEQDSKFEEIHATNISSAVLNAEQHPGNTTDTNSSHNIAEQSSVADDGTVVDVQGGKGEGLVEEEIGNTDTTPTKIITDYASSGELPSEVIGYAVMYLEDYELETQNTTAINKTTENSLSN